MRFAFAILIVLLGAAGAWAEDTEKRKLADELHTLVMDKFPEYRRIHEAKAMAACIEWDRPMPPFVMIHGVFSTRTGLFTDAPIFTPTLGRDAVRRCKDWAAREQVPCKCQLLDRDGKNVLKVP